MPESALDRHVSFIRHIRDEDKQRDDEDGFYALECHGFFAEFGFSHVVESIEVGFVLVKRVYESEVSDSTARSCELGGLFLVPAPHLRSERRLSKNASNGGTYDLSG